MSGDLAVLVPVLDRPHRVGPFLASVEATTPGASVLFLADGGDDAEWEAIEEQEDLHPGIHVLLNPEGGSYAEKINRGVEVTQAPWIFTAADDLEPRPGWFQAAKKYGAGVVGVNDLIRRNREHATHFLFTREYAERPSIDGSRGPFFEGYHHWWCDDEVIATARHRGEYVYAADAEVRHLHPMTGAAPDDATYRRGRARREGDRKLFESRRHLWA